ncbi:Uncharacterised protein [Mycobacteroides abscessus subsp. abscessus]|nr:Uncharacterised protein [Mycobacteroides abscessus subsp. abscessus]
MRAIIGSNIAREAPLVRRAITTCRPMSLECGRYSASGNSGFPLARATRS